jgi:hypothetical protein
VNGTVAVTPVASVVPSCASCSQNSECSDGVACDGQEVCNLGTHSCQAGTPIDCSALNDVCNTGVCTEPAGACVASAKPDTTTCDTGQDTCSIPDHCVAGACLNNGGGGDSDGDGICNTDDNCPTDPNPDQADIDGDGIGNVCDPNEGPLNPIRVRFKGNLIVTRDSSSVSARGQLETLLPGEVFPGGDGSITVAIHDGSPTPNAQTHKFTTAECRSTPTTIRCRTADRTVTGNFKTSAAQNKVWKFNVKFRKAGFGAGPFQGPATVTFTYGPSIDRVGDVTDCVISFSGMACRQVR